MNKLFLLIILLLPFLASADKIKVDGSKRSYIVYVPKSYSGKKPVPLLFVLHGGGGHARRMIRFSGFNSYADRDTCIVVYPQGYKKHWNDGRNDDPAETSKQHIDDVAFMEALYQQLKKEYLIDTTRVYASGPSNGGMMCYKLACEWSSRLAAIAPVIANMPLDLVNHCNAAHPVSMLIIHGTADPLMPYEGGDVHFFKKKLGKVLSAQQTIELWKNRYGCYLHTQPFITPAGLPGDPTSVFCDDFLNEKTDIEIKHFIVNGGGHTWPGGEQYLPKWLIGRVSTRINASALIWDFLMRKRK